MRFFGLSLGTYNAGFKTKQAIFEWVATSRLFDVKHLRSQGPGIKKVKPDRRMYAEFVEWVEKQRNTSESGSGQSHEPVLEGMQTNVRAEALVFFKKKKAFEALALERSNKIWLKNVFSEHSVRDWADMGGYRVGVKLIMDEVKVRLGGAEGILIFLEKKGRQGLKDFVLQVKDELGIVSEHSNASPFNATTP
jgi:hypothetical protein